MHTSRILRAFVTVVGLGTLLSASEVGAAGLDQLRAFLDGAKSGRTTFRQVVAAKGRGAPQESAGTFAFARPGRFRWSYEKPFEQLIVGDGEKLWIYDRDLNQVIVRTLDRALGTSPAALLAGSNALEANFALADAGSADGLDFVDAKPKAADTGFERVRIGFRENLPRTMELRDTFGNVTTLSFGAFERNPSVDPGLFRFVPPKGADVVGE
jgi:outer membrane lipoprotein carrier protein